MAFMSLAVIEGLLAYPWREPSPVVDTLVVPVGMLCLHDGVRQLRYLAVVGPGSSESPPVSSPRPSCWQPSGGSHRFLSPTVL